MYTYALLWKYEKNRGSKGEVGADKGGVRVTGFKYQKSPSRLRYGVPTPRCPR